MKPEEYHTEIQIILVLAALVRPLNIAGVLEAMRRAETLGPVVDPTLYNKASIHLKWQVKVAEAALRFQRQVEQVASDPRFATIGEKEP